MTAEIVTGEFCASWFSCYEVPSSTTDEVYLVTLAGTAGAHCTCKGFEYRGECKHLSYVMENACLWNCQWHDGNDPVSIRPTQTPNESIHGVECKNCGGPLIPVKIAV